MGFGGMGAGRRMGGMGTPLGRATYNIFVDSVNGSDANSGATPSLAKATLNGVTQRSGLRIGLARGSVFRESWTITNDGVSVGAYGSGTAPRISNSVLHTSGWTLVTGTEYKKVIGYTALNAFVVSGDTVTKLTLGTAGSLTSGQFGVTGSGGTTEVRVNIGSDPNAASIEIPASDGNYNLRIKASNVIVRNIRSWFSPGSGATITPVSTTIDNILGESLDVSYNSIDGWGGSALNTTGAVTATNCVIKNSVIKRNGQTRTTSGAAGDGISFHDTCTGKAINCNIQDNEKSGITNQHRVSFDTINCYFRNNNQEWLVLDDELGLSATGGTHKLLYSVVVVPGSADTSGVWSSSIARTALPTVIVENNVIYGEAKVAGQSGVRLSFGAMTAKNNIISGFSRGIDWQGATATGSLDNDYNCMFGNTTNYFNNGTPGVVAGAHDLTSDPKFVSTATLDFSLQGTSPCINAGTNVGLTSDKNGVAVPLATNPCIGAYERLAG